MDVQQYVALAIVAVAAAYLGKNFIKAARAFFSARSGCASGCGKCGFAARDTDLKHATSSVPHQTIIPLADLHNLPGKSKHPSQR